MQTFSVLFCDYDGDFRLADTLSRVGYSVDQIRPDALRQVSVGEHKIYIFAYTSEAQLPKLLKTCEKLKMAQLSTPLVLVSFCAASPEFLNHQTSPHRADAYVVNPKTASPLLDAMDELVGCPLPPNVKGALQYLNAEEKKSQEVTVLEAQIADLQKKIQDLEGDRSRTEDALEAQRAYYKPKLKALLEGQKIQIQSETERLKVQLSEVEAKLLDREMRVKDLENYREKNKKKIEEAAHHHEKAQNTLREFYQNKIRALESELSEVRKAGQGESKAL